VDEESFVGGECDFVMAVETSAVVFPTVGAFDHPPARLDDEPMSGSRPGHDVDADSGFGGGVGDRLAGVSLIQPDVGDGRSDAFGFAQQFREGGAVLHIGLGDNGRDEDAGGVDEDVAFDVVDLTGCGPPRVSR
jgi:hypothetical protein